jgi:hypothetical protein
VNGDRSRQDYALIDKRHEDAVQSATALDLVSAGEYVRIGNNRRIRAIRPLNTCVGWSGGNHTTRRVRNDQGVIVSAPLIREHKPVFSTLQG